MKKALVLGSTGAMGRYTVPALAEKGYQVDAVSLDDVANGHPSVRNIKGNVFEKGFLDELLKNHYDGIVDFMIYREHNFPQFHKKYLDNTEHYIFLSTSRVYANEEVPVKESSPRLLDVSRDSDLLGSNDYCIHKARDENMLFVSDYKNWTIVRPTTTYSTMRFQLATLEAPHNVGRALEHKKVVLPIQAKDIYATMTWGGDVAKMLSRLLFLPESSREIYNVCTGEAHTWGKIAEFYEELCGLEAVWVDKEDYLSILSPEKEISIRWQLEYARLFDRAMDNSKILKATGLKQENFVTLYDGLAREIKAYDRERVWNQHIININRRMDEYLAQKGY